MRMDQIALIGNPNCGKTTLFNALTGSHQHVGNWSGVTVEKKMGFYHYQGQRVNVIDLPGTYSIENQDIGISQDELLARRYVINDTDSLIINIIDATNLQRNLYLTTQLLDLKRPMIVVLNMMDSLQSSGETLDEAILAERLGCPVIGISANRKKGIDKLLVLINEMLQSPVPPAPNMFTLGESSEKIIQQCIQGLPEQSSLRKLNRWQFFELMLHGFSDQNLSAEERQQLIECCDKLAQPYDGELDIALASVRYDAIDELNREVMQRPRQASASLTDRIDNWMLGRISGIPLFLFIMYLMFMLSINVGSAFIDFFDIFFDTLLVKGSEHILTELSAPDWLIMILSNGVGEGIKTVSTFIPVIAAMFLCLSFLEDTGYLARAAMIVDRGMQLVGLPGKAFVPMLVGFGCNVPAIMGTRTLENPRDRLMSIMMIPYMSCGARLPVYALFVAVFFPVNGHNIVFLLYLIGILVAVFTGLILKRTLLPGNNTPFVMELPPYRMPTLRNLLTLTWEKLKSFILRAGKAIVLMVMVLSVLNSVGTDGSFGNQNSDKSLLATVGKKITPLFEPMGIDQKNWPATVGIFTGIFAKEAVIGTLNSLYAQLGHDAETEEEDEPFDLKAGIKEALDSIPKNLSELWQNIGDPFGIKAGLSDGDISEVQKDNDINDNTIKQISLLFTGSNAVFAYLIFILLYTPCAAALGAVYREVGSKWTIIVALWTLAIAWISATGFYQLSILTSAPVHALSWLAGLAILMVILFYLLRWAGRNSADIVLAEPIPNTSNRGCH